MNVVNAAEKNQEVTFRVGQRIQIKVRADKMTGEIDFSYTQIEWDVVEKRYKSKGRDRGWQQVVNARTKNF